MNTNPGVPLPVALNPETKLAQLSTLLDELFPLAADEETKP